MQRRALEVCFANAETTRLHLRTACVAPSFFRLLLHGLGDCNFQRCNWCRLSLEGAPPPALQSADSLSLLSSESENSALPS
ncbi:hypothetical protein ANANG_G00314440 [Anguilla anguilla]|uniref:Uncharacterized protein n=1 Tax=Anguilla anguilla TaxID=7936 RepID=A0A9D3RHJ5_ANGAN|nr:hypothetical protein ANANG_G00314440 [Anguilla anguilla]